MNNRNIYSGNFGIEKENIRVDNKGRISKLPHSKIFGENNPYITRDFSLFDFGDNGTALFFIGIAPYTEH